MVYDFFAHFDVFVKFRALVVDKLFRSLGNKALIVELTVGAADNGVCTVCGYEKSETGQGNLEDIQEAELSIHFMELGNANAGDSTLIKCGDTEAVIIEVVVADTQIFMVQVGLYYVQHHRGDDDNQNDYRNRNDDFRVLFCGFRRLFIDTYCTDGKLEYVIATHAHEDHIAALAGEEGKNNGVLYSYEIGTIMLYVVFAFIYCDKSVQTE